jgi:hypothetical protein
VAQSRLSCGWGLCHEALALVGSLTRAKESKHQRHADCGDVLAAFGEVGRVYKEIQENSCLMGLGRQVRSRVRIERTERKESIEEAGVAESFGKIARLEIEA